MFIWTDSIPKAHQNGPNSKNKDTEGLADVGVQVVQTAAQLSRVRGEAW